ncbi:MAG: DUF6194 family protein [Ahrensia sp.]|nr:DUF6194 family protein [Ahrensia sp.]
MTAEVISSWIVETFDHVVAKGAWGETSFFVNPGRALPSGAYFATIKQKDGDNDRASALDREAVYRLNFGPGRRAFEELFGSPPARPGKGKIIEGDYDFKALDVIMPHPIYGWMSWMCVLNPSRRTFELCQPLLYFAHAKASAAAEKRLGR